MGKDSKHLTSMKLKRQIGRQKCHLAIRRWRQKDEKGIDLEPYKANREKTHILQTETHNYPTHNHTREQPNKQLTCLMHPIFPSLSGNNL